MPAPEKVVNYRKNFIGKYIGAAYTTTQTCIYGNPNTYGLLDTTVFTGGITWNVTLDNTNESNVIIDGAQSYNIYYVYPDGNSRPSSKAGHDPRQFSAIFRNDSLYWVCRDYLMAPQTNPPTLLTHYFNGVKQH